MSDGLLDDGEFYKLQKTCDICKRTERLAVWNRIANENGSSVLLARSGSDSAFVCPICVKAGKHR